MCSLGTIWTGFSLNPLIWIQCEPSLNTSRFTLSLFWFYKHPTKTFLCWWNTEKSEKNQTEKTDLVFCGGANLNSVLTCLFWSSLSPVREKGERGTSWRRRRNDGWKSAGVDERLNQTVNVPSLLNTDLWRAAGVDGHTAASVSSRGHGTEECHPITERETLTTYL